MTEHWKSSLKVHYKHEQSPTACIIYFFPLIEKSTPKTSFLVKCHKEQVSEYGYIHWASTLCIFI